MTIKRFVFSLLSTLCMAQTMQAIPAYPYPQKIKQADGSYVTVITKGDEHGHYSMTTDGYPVWFNEKSGNYEYATLSNGHIAGSGIIAADATKRTTKALNFLKAQNGEGIKKAVMDLRNTNIIKKSRMAGPQRIRINDFPTTGDQHSLVILVEFSDKKFTTTGDDTHDFYNKMLNQEGFTYSNGANGSARDFYIASSGGRFTPTFDVAGPVAVSKTASYYGANGYGGDQYDRISEMIVEACTGLDDEVDFSKYDTNNDGYVDNIYFFYAGYGEADGGGSSTIWPHSYKLSDLLEMYDKKPLELDGKIINSYACSNEIMGRSNPAAPTGIGTFVHEFGHVLGLGDHYATSYNSSFTPGQYDAMDMGSYNNNMNTPPLFSAFERGELGWLDYIELTANTDTIIKLPELSSSNMAYRVSVEGTNGREFYVLENRQQHGWDTYLPGHGMLMWHIDIDTAAWENNVINNTPNHQRVDLVEADNKRNNSTLAGDPFPGTSEVTQWAVKSWAGDSLIYIDDIQEKEKDIFLMLNKANITIEKPQLNVVEAKDSSLTVGWKNVDLATKYKLNVYEVGDGTKTPLKNYTNETYYSADTIHIENLKPDTPYEINLVATRGTHASDTAIVEIKTKELTFDKKFVDAINATNIDTDGFTVDWSSIADADTYIIHLYKHYYNEESVNRTHGFTGGSGKLPELWKTYGTFVSTTGSYGESAPSLRLSQLGGYVLVAYPKSQISSLSFWGKPSPSANGEVHIERYADGKWNEIDSIATIDLERVGKSYKYDFEQADSVRIRIDKNNGYFYIDDISVDCHDIYRLPVEKFDSINVGNTLQYTFSGLEEGVSYGFVVYGIKEGILSRPSEELTIVTSKATAIESVTTNNSSTATVYYDLSGRKLTSLEGQPKGVYILRKDGKTVKILKR